MKLGKAIVICLFSVLLLHVNRGLIKIDFLTGIDRLQENAYAFPNPGQYANFSSLHYAYNGSVLASGYYNITYQSPATPIEDCINATRDLYVGGLVQAWQIVNTSDRRIVENSYNIWSGVTYYEFWIFSSVGLGDNITWWTSPSANATVTASETLNLLSRTIDCWKVECVVAGVSPDAKDLNNTAWFDKSTGHCVKFIEYQTDGYSVYWILYTDIIWQNSTIYIRADGSIDPPTAPISSVDNVTYVLTGNITSDADGIVIERNNTVLDGAGYALQGIGSGNGLILSHISNVTTRNMEISGFFDGILLSYSETSSILGNNMTANDNNGVMIDSSSSNNITGNSITGNKANGVYSQNSWNNSLYENWFTANIGHGVYFSESSYCSISENNVNSNMHGVWLDDSSNNNEISENHLTSQLYFGVALSRVSFNFVSGNSMANNSVGVFISESSSFNTIVGNSIVGNTGHGVYIDSSSNNTVSRNIMANNLHGVGVCNSSTNNGIHENNITASSYFTIYFNGSCYNTVSGNNISFNGNGVCFYSFSDFNTIVENNITGNTGHGVYIDGSSNNYVFGNSMASNMHGVGVSNSSTNNIMCGNNITTNSYFAIYFNDSSCNTVYHNNIISNTVQVYDSSLLNVWDDGYPSGGNYWSDYNGSDCNQGLDQNNTGSDGIGDSPYGVNSNPQTPPELVQFDNYPLMGMFNSYNVTYYTPPAEPHACNVTVISNSTISDFVAPIWIEHPEVIFLEFNVTGEQGSIGFCRVSFPTAMMNGTYHVSVNGTEVPCTLLSCSDANYSYLYFTYAHSTEEVIITPEFPSFLILPLLMLTTLVAVIFCKKKYP
jgi:parallel beta-helix repeat protein